MKFDDLVPVEDRELIRKFDQTLPDRCAFLGKEGRFFYYCNLNMGESSPDDIKAARQKEVAEVMSTCASDFNICYLYQINR